MGGRTGENACAPIHEERRIGVEGIRRALVMAEMWESIRAQVYAEDQLQVPDRIGNQERVEIARALANLRNEAPEGNMREIRHEEQAEEILQMRRDERDVREERRSHQTAPTQRREERPPTICDNTLNVQLSVRAETESRKRLAVRQELADEEESREKAPRNAPHHRRGADRRNTEERAQ